MTQTAPVKYVSLAQVLVEEGLLTEEQARKVNLNRLKTGETEESIIQALRVINEVDFIKAKAKYLRVPFVDLDTTAFSPEALSFVPRSVAEKYRLVPFYFDKKENVLSVAMTNPLDLETVEFIEKKSGLKVKPVMGLEKQIDFFVREKYERERGITSEVSKALDERKKEEEDIVAVKKKVSTEAPVAKIVNTILEFAVKSRSSDVHIEPQEENIRIRYRIDGILQEKYLLPRNVHEAVVSRIKILSNLKIDEKRVPQDGRFMFMSDEKEVDLRVSTMPTTYGEKVVMRLLRKAQKVPTLPDLGLRGRALKNLNDAIKRPHGIIIVCGPTGSGKTTTLYSALTIISTPGVNVSTIEDPVEYQIDGINQVQVNRQAGLTFPTALRSFLRQDPDIIMVGEIRDTETAELAINAALTGHLVFSTLHTNDASGAPPRLLDMGVEPFLLVSSLNCVVAQRVVRRVCPDCVKYVPISKEMATEFKQILGPVYGAIEEKWKKDGKELTVPQIVGCDKCGNTGYLGRIGIFEVMPISEKMGKMIVEKAPASKLQELAMEEGMLTMKQDGYVKVLEGVTTREEVVRVAEY